MHIDAFGQSLNWLVILLSIAFHLIIVIHIRKNSQIVWILHIYWNNKIIEIQIIIIIVRVSEHFSKMLVLSGVFNTRILETTNNANQDYMYMYWCSCWNGHIEYIETTAYGVYGYMCLDSYSEGCGFKSYIPGQINWHFFSTEQDFMDHLKSLLVSCKDCVQFFNLMNFIRWAPHVPRYTLWLPTPKTLQIWLDRCAGVSS
jgi:hypothetical protein